MAVLSSKARNKLPKSEFALPGARKYPINDKNHAINAKARAEQMAKKGKIANSTKKKIDSAANKVIKRK